MSQRGDFVTVAMQRDFGKPRPALVVQSDLHAELDSVVVVPVTTDLRSDATFFRLDVEPTPGNGLQKPSQLMVDKVSAVIKGRIRSVIGRADEQTMARVAVALAEFLALV